MLYLDYKDPARATLRLATIAEEVLAKRFGGLVRRLRVKRGYSQDEFAFRVGLHQTYVGSVERGERNVTIRTADKIAKALGTNLAAMFAELERGHAGPGKRC